MREEGARTQARPSHQIAKYEAEKNNDSDEQQRFCDLDDDDENLPFSRELKKCSGFEPPCDAQDTKV